MFRERGREGGKEREGEKNELVIILHRQHHKGAGALHYYKHRHTHLHTWWKSSWLTPYHFIEQL